MDLNGVVSTFSETAELEDPVGGPIGPVQGRGRIESFYKNAFTPMKQLAMNVTKTCKGINSITRSFTIRLILAGRPVATFDGHQALKLP